jgi:Uma2 family endonuclease
MLAPDQEEFYPYYEDTVTESDWHVVAIHYLLGALRAHFAERPDAWAFSNMFVYDQPGNRDRKVSPDVFVAFGCSHEKRRVFRTWLDGGPPVAVFEVTSRTSRKTDQHAKRIRYSEMGVQEYFLFDPLGEYLPGQFRVYRREGQELVPVVTQGSYRSELLGLDIVVEREFLRLVNLTTGAPYLSIEEARSIVMAERERAEAERKRADAERERAVAERERTDAERLRAEALEEQVRQLQQRLDQLGG